MRELPVATELAGVNMRLKPVPRSVLAKNFSLSESAFANLPTDSDYQCYIFAGTVPGPLASDDPGLRSSAY